MIILFKQIVKFIGISGIGWIIDFITYTILSYTIGDLFISNIISSFIGVTFVFSLASYKIFKDNGKMSLKFKYVIYLIYQCLLVYSVSMVLIYVNDIIKLILQTYGFMSNVLSKILITPITMICNFIVMKLLVEKV